MNQKERMLAGLPYKAWLDGLPEESMENAVRVFEFNNCNPADTKRADRIIRSIFGKAGKNITVRAPFHCDYGKNIEVGDNFYANFNAVILDVGKVIIGNNVLLAPNVAIYTAGHPIHPDSRNSGYEYGIAVTIGDNVWIGGNSVINPGVSIGNNCVVGAGSIVVDDIPENSVAVGNPARVIRKITDEDRKYYFKNREFDVNDYNL